MAFNDLVAFTAPQLQASLTSSFFVDFAQRVLVEGFSLEKSFSTMLAATSQSNLARHTNVVHIHATPGNSDLDGQDFIFSHPKLRPWGNRLPPSCPRCKSPRSWSSPVCQDKAIVFLCNRDKCKEKCRFVKPEGYELSKVKVSGGRWMSRAYTV